MAVCGVPNPPITGHEFKQLLLTLYCVEFLVTFLIPISLMLYRTALIINEIAIYLKKTDRCRRNSRNEPVGRRNVLIFRFVLRPVLFIVFILPIYVVIFLNYFFVVLHTDGSIETASTRQGLILKLAFTMCSTLNLSMHALFIILAFCLNKKFRRVVVKLINLP